ncbi:hypothetical protein LNV93_01670 [Klebsiella pneumoniae]|uniref:hypothetical protein n=1 Tax=Klebsiella TaxID=570 RepID=UPI00284AE0AD|nr:hypothetical protein [Klebsiella pneumoniae]MCJ4332702.1 hypothetical protein [Klebsiella pneumoniae]MDR4829627.1 hypothetical protein [Klebsiella pneumoniae]
MSVHLVEAELEYKNDRITLPLKDDSNGGSGGYMLEIKVAKLETDVGYIKRDIDELRADVKTISQNMAIAIERLDNIRTSLDKKPSTDTIDRKIADAKLAILLGVPAIIAIGTGIYKIVQQYL